MSNIASYYLSKNKLEHKVWKCPFLMSVALQVATKLFDQQAPKLPILFCNLIWILLLTRKYLIKYLTCDIFLKPNPAPTIYELHVAAFFLKELYYIAVCSTIKNKIRTMSVSVIIMEKDIS